MNVADLTARVQSRIEDGCVYEDSRILELLNEGQRVFCLLTLCLESMRTLELDPGQRWYQMISRWPDWIVPLRVRLEADREASEGSDWGSPMGNEVAWGESQHGALTSSTPKLRPVTLTELRAENAAWLLATGTPRRYGVLGFDLLYLDRMPASEDLGRRLLVTYARSPLVMDAASTPEIPIEDHFALADWAILRLRLGEGGDVLQSAVREHLSKFLETAKARAAKLRARATQQNYDTRTVEWKMPDLSKLLSRREKKAA